jgi:acetyltransferase-like isoleucine patch superfamily enzyme
MNRNELLNNKEINNFYKNLYELHNVFGQGLKEQFNRSLPFTDELFDRWERAKNLGFGEGSSIYDSSYVFGNVKVGTNTWIGPFTVIDGSGSLQIGDHCTISAGVHIYTHDNILQTITGGKQPAERQKVSIGNCTYIGPKSIISKGITIGDHCIIGAASFVNKSLPSFSVAHGTPAKVAGTVVLEKDSFHIRYH